MNQTDIDPEYAIQLYATLHNRTYSDVYSELRKHTLNMKNLSFDMENIFYNQSDMFYNTSLLNSRDPMSIVLPITVLYAIIFIAGLLGNVITCIVISRNKCMHTATNYYLFNLAVSDLLLLVCGMPPEVYNIWYPTSYPFQQSFCILQGLLAETSTNATVLTITSFTVERYIAICHPFRQHTMSKLSRAIKFILAIWIIAFCLAVPQAMQFGVVDVEGGGAYCTVKNKFIEHAFEVSGFVFFVGPMTVICVLYVLIGLKLRKSKLLQGIKRKTCDYGRNVSGQTRVIRMLIAVAVAFFICWAPFHAQRLMAVYGSSLKHSVQLYDTIYTILTYTSGILYFLSTCINPLLYNIMSRKFRNAFKSTISQHCGLGKNHQLNINNTYSALSRYGGSLKTTNTINRNNLPDLPKLEKRESELSIIHQTSTKRPDELREIEKTTELNSPKKQKTNENASNKASSLFTIAEKLKRSTKKVLSFKTSPINTNGNCSKENKLKKEHSTESGTISNSSLQELDEEEFTSAELAKFMGEINNEIRQDRIV